MAFMLSRFHGCELTQILTMNRQNIPITSSRADISSSTPDFAVSGQSNSTLLGQDKSHQQQDIVGFVSDGAVQTAEYLRPKELDKLLETLHPNTEENHAISDFLSRPIRLPVISFSDQSIGSIIATLDVLTLLRTDPNFLLFRQKLSGFYGFSAKVTLRVVVNAQPFQAGIFHTIFAPFYTGYEPTTYAPLNWVTGNTFLSLPFASGLPRKLCNISTQSEISITAPYVGPNVFIDLSDPTANWGAFLIQSYIPLAAAAAGSSCDLTPYLSFSDIKLFGASNGFSAQGPIPNVSSPSTTSEIEERHDTSTGSISGLAQELAAIPLMSAVAPEATFALRAAGNVARAMGFSKPNAEPNHNRLAITPFGQPQNVDGTSNAFKLGASVDQGTKSFAFGNTEEDTMSLMHLISRPNFYDTFVWDPSILQGTKLRSFPVTPDCRVYNTVASGTDFFPTKLRYVAEHFGMWRGGIVYTFHIAATKFHSGRLRLVYDTSLNPTATYPSPYLFTKIIDIRDGYSFSVLCPYFHTTPWKHVSATSAPYDNGTVITANQVSLCQPWISEYAQLAVYVENELRRPDTVSTFVTINVEMHAAPDFQLSIPQITINAPYNQHGTAALDLEHAMSKLEMSHVHPTPLDTEPFEAQGPETCEVDVPMFNMVGEMGAGMSEVSSLLALQTTVGEAITSVRQLIKRYQTVGVGTLTGSQTITTLPFLFPYSGDAGGNFSPHFLTRFQCLYRFWHGGLRYLYQNANMQSVPWTVSYYPNSEIVPAVVLGAPTFGNQSATFYSLFLAGGNVLADAVLNLNTATQFPISENLQSGVEIQFPYYCDAPFLPTGPHAAITSLAAYFGLIQSRQTPMGVSILGRSTKQTNGSGFIFNDYLYIHRAAADDFQFDYDIGAPVCRLTVAYSIAGV
jgi:hypothetical protein